MAYLLGVAGLLPFVACAIAALSKGPYEAIGLAALIGYGAVILAFLGGVHWGVVLAPAASPRLQRLRLALGVVPSLIGWAALGLGIASLPELALALLILGFGGTVVVESRWARESLLPSGYMGLRWMLSVVVVMALVTVLALRLIGASIIF
jgi:hypothetical protein